MPLSVRVNSVLCLADCEFLTNSPEVTNLRVIYASDSAGANHVLDSTGVDALLVLLPLSSDGAEEVIKRFRARSPQAPVLIYEPLSAGDQLSGFENCERISGEIPETELRDRVLRSLQPRTFSSSSPGEEWADALVGSSTAMRQIVEIIRLVGPRRSTVLITGETGSGKEVAARAIHAASNRSGAKMVAVNCAALPDNLLEAELFGHTKGAFTGAVNARVGLFEQAHRGTIFLDEIGELPMPLQAKLLRVLQEREIQRIGSSKTIPVDVRVIAASNANLLEAVAQRRFREDLYYRLNVVALQIPALRERVTDIPELADYFLARI